MAQFPSKKIAELSLPLPHAGPGLRQHRRLLMASGIPYDSAAGPRHLRRALGHHDGRRLRHLGRDGRGAGAFPGYEDNAADMLRVIRNHRRAAYGHDAGYEKLATPPVPLDAAACPTTPRRGRQARLGPGHRARRGARLPQRAVDRDRAHRHHRPRHGLRHHRHRARLRAGEVQEAGRRRLLQDHQPGRARGPAHARLRRGRDRRDRGLCGRARHAGPGAGHQPRHAQGQGLHRRGAAQARHARSRRRSTSSSPSTAGRSARSS